jgi:hypothetical protein
MRAADMLMASHRLRGRYAVLSLCKAFERSDRFVARHAIDVHHEGHGVTPH